MNRLASNMGLVSRVKKAFFLAARYGTLWVFGLFGRQNNHFNGQLTSKMTFILPANKGPKTDKHYVPSEATKFKHICASWQQHGHLLCQEDQDYYTQLKAEQHLAGNSSSGS